MAHTDYDPFRPRHEPALSIYLAFQAEAMHRPKLSHEDWAFGEINAVHTAAERAAVAHGLRAPSIEEVERAEQYARGSIDYGAKWAYQVVEAMRRPEPRS